MKENKVAVILMAYIIPSSFWMLQASTMSPPYTNVFETLYINEGRHLLRVDERHEGEFVVAEGTELIGRGALSGCYALTSVIIPDSVTNIMAGAFSACGYLTNVVFGSGLREIGKHAFAGGKNLTPIVLPDSVETIREGAFLTVPPVKIKLGKGLRNVEPYAFGSSFTLGTNSIERFVTISPSNQWIRVEGTQVVPIKKEERTGGKD